jgi:hypothetical protein
MAWLNRANGVGATIKAGNGPKNNTLLDHNMTFHIIVNKGVIKISEISSFEIDTAER